MNLISDRPNLSPGLHATSSAAVATDFSVESLTLASLRLHSSPALECLTFKFQQELNAFYLRQILPPSHCEQTPKIDEHLVFQASEQHWNLYEESRLDLTTLPTTAGEFNEWYQQLYRRHRAETAPFFEYLANDASIEEMALYISLEEQVDARFDDVIALAQLGMVGDMKLALAENFWDEMGLGHLDEMHTRLFEESATYMRQFLRDVDITSMIPMEALKNGNLLLMYALNRNFSARLLGALAILEHTAPYRFSRTVRGLRRLEMPEEVIYYHELHIEVDANHGRQLFERVLKPLVEESPSALREVCIGCLIRYNVAADYYKGLERAMATLRNAMPSLQHSQSEKEPA